MIKKIIFLLAVVFLASCSVFTRKMTDYASSKTIINAMGNGLIGPAFNNLTNYDKTQAIAAEYTALEHAETGKTIKWQSKSGKNFGTVIPGQPYRVGSQNCRQYSHSFTINGIAQAARGSACRNDNGSWNVN